MLATHRMSKWSFSVLIRSNPGHFLKRELKNNRDARFHLTAAVTISAVYKPAANHTTIRNPYCNITSRKLSTPSLIIKQAFQLSLFNLFNSTLTLNGKTVNAYSQTRNDMWTREFNNLPTYSFLCSWLYHELRLRPSRRGINLSKSNYIHAMRLYVIIS